MPISISELVKVPLILHLDLDQSGKLVLYSSNETGIPHLYLIDAKAESKPKQLTNGKDPVIFGELSPKGNEVLYLQDKDGNELHHMFLLSIGGEVRRITKKPFRTLGVDWSPNGREITRAFATMKNCGLETFNLKTGETFILKKSNLPLMGVEYSHDGKWIACTRALGFKNLQIFILNREDPDDTIVYSIKDNSREQIPKWSPDDKRLAFISDAKGRPQVVIQEFQGNERIFLELEESEEAIEGETLWDATGEKVYYVVSKHSRTYLHAHQINGEKQPALPFPEGTIPMAKISKDGKTIVAVHSSMTSPPGIYIYKVGEESVKPLTSRKFNIDLTKLKQIQSIWYESFDGLKIHGWYMPAATGKPPHPAIIYVHGGPWAQVFDSWFQGVFLHSLSQSGFAVFAPNFRGSTGYGAEFQNLDIGDPGGGDLEDIVYAAEWLKKRPEIDGSRIGIMGASYGGYMTLIALTKKPEKFAAGVSLVPVVDWMEMYGLSDALFRAFMETLLDGKPSEKEELYRDRSPMTHIANIKAPVMIMAGKQDSRCPIQPIEKFVKKLKEMNHPHEFVLEEKAGHASAFLKWEESIPIITKIIDYFKKVLM